MPASAKADALLEGPVLRSLVTLAVPIVLANILQAGYQLTDAFWVGRLGGAAIAAVSVSFPIMFLSIAIGAGLAVAGSILIAQYFGARNQTMVNHVAAQTLLMIVLASVVLGGLGYLAAPALLRLMGVTQAVYVGALPFMRIGFVGLAFTFAFSMFQAIMRGVGEANLPVYIVLGTVILNFGLDPLFIFGWGRVPALGVTGAAIATLITQSIAAFVGLWILFRGQYGIHLSLKNFVPDFAYMKRAFQLGFPASIEMSARALGLTVMTFLIASFGTLAIAAYGVGSNVLQVVMIPAMGLSMAVSTLVGQNIGAGHIERAARIGRLGAWLSFWSLTAIGVIVFLFAPHFVAFFVPDDAGVIAAGATFLRIMSLTWGFIGVQFALTGVLRASGSMVLAMTLTMVSLWGIQFPLAFALSKGTALGVNGIWWAFPIANVVIVAVTIGIYMRGGWKTKRLTGASDALTGKITEEVLTVEAYTNRPT